MPMLATATSKSSINIKHRGCVPYFRVNVHRYCLSHRFKNSMSVKMVAAGLLSLQPLACYIGAGIYWHSNRTLFGFNLIKPLKNEIFWRVKWNFWGPPQDFLVTEQCGCLKIQIDLIRCQRKVSRTLSALQRQLRWRRQCHSNSSAQLLLRRLTVATSLAVFANE